MQETDPPVWNVQYSDLPKMAYIRKTPTGLIPGKEVETEVLLLAYEAEQLGITWEIVPYSELWKFSYREHDKYLLKHFDSQMKTVGNRLCFDKDFTRSILAFHDIHIPKGFTITKSQSEQEWQNVFTSLKNQPSSNQLPELTAKMFSCIFLH